MTARCSNLREIVKQTLAPGWLALPFWARPDASYSVERRCADAPEDDVVWV
jgi:hypothetical protein